MTSLDSLPPLASAGLDRAAEERADDGLLDRLRVDAATRVLVIVGDRAPLVGPGSLRYVSPADAPTGAVWAFLGRDADRRAVVAAVLPDRADAAADVSAHWAPLRSDGADTDAGGAASDAPVEWAPLRAVGGDLAPADAAAFVSAVALGRWLLDAPFCPACGTRTEVRDAGWSRHCPACGRAHFPRTDPAVIVAVRSATDPDLLLLGSNAAWGADRFSCFAGFSEAGESLEAAVVREVREEAGVEVVDLEYRGSQVWPYPRSLMLGFLATASDDGAARADGEEIAAVRWFHRREIGTALAGRGDVLLPGGASIAHRLIADWYRSGA